MGEPWVVKSNIVGNGPPFWGSPISYLTVRLQGCYQVLERCNKTYFEAVHQLCKIPRASVSGQCQRPANVDSSDATARRCCGVGVRVSAPLRRVAAPYGDGCERISLHSHLISLLLFGCEVEAELAVDMARFCVRENGAKTSIDFDRSTPVTPTALF